MSAGEHAYCFRKVGSGIRQEEELILSTFNGREKEGARTSARVACGRTGCAIFEPRELN